MNTNTNTLTPDLLQKINACGRAANDSRIRDTACVVDALLKVETPAGLAWHRYNDDGYGEHEDASPFDGTGIGRVWPLLVGERAHYELAAGRVKETKRLLTALESFANEGGLISEQVWDSPDIPERGLHFAFYWPHADHWEGEDFNVHIRSLRHEDSILKLKPQGNHKRS